MKNPSTECAYNIKEKRSMYTLTARNVKVGGFGMKGLWPPKRFQFLLSLHPWVLLWVMGRKKLYSKQYL